MTTKCDFTTFFSININKNIINEQSLVYFGYIESCWRKIHGASDCLENGWSAGRSRGAAAGRPWPEATRHHVTTLGLRDRPAGNGPGPSVATGSAGMLFRFPRSARKTSLQMMSFPGWCHTYNVIARRGMLQKRILPRFSGFSQINRRGMSQRKPKGVDCAVVLNPGRGMAERVSILNVNRAFILPQCWCVSNVKNAPLDPPLQPGRPRMRNMCSTTATHGPHITS